MVVPVFKGVHVTRSLDLCVCFVDRCLSFCPFSFGHRVVCPSSIYGFWYLQTLLDILLSSMASLFSKYIYLIDKLVWLYCTFICHEHLAAKHTLIFITPSCEYDGLITSITICCMQASVNIRGIVEAYKYVYNKLV